MTSLETSTVNQDTIKLIGDLKQPITIINGSFDVLTVGQVLKDIAKNNDNIELVTIRTGHIITKFYSSKILDSLLHVK